MINNQWVMCQKAILNDYNISDYIANITIYNDIENAGFVCEVLYNDVSDIRGKMPLVGGEILELILVDGNKNKFKKDLVLSTIKTKVIDDANTYLNMTFISEKSFYMGINRDNKSYNDTISNVISTYCTNRGTATTKLEQIIVPGWSQTKAVRYMIDNFTKEVLWRNIH